MSKVGRNDLCPCGSGKKYKKCCMKKHEVERQIEKNPHVFLFEDTPGNPRDWEEEDNSGIEARPLHKKIQAKKRNKTLPDISEAEQTIISTWWNEYTEEEGGVVAQINKITEFMDTHPALMGNLELVEAHFILGSSVINQGVEDRYIELLQRFRREFPEAYLIDFPYLDTYIIQYLIAKQRSDEVPAYLNYFKEYSADSADDLFEILELFRATGNTALVVELTTTSYIEITHSEEVMRGDDILHPMLMSNYYGNYLNKPRTEDDLRELGRRLSELEVDFSDGHLQAENLDNYLKHIETPPTQAYLTTLPEDNNLVRYYNEVALSFMGYLFIEKGMNLVKAEYYRELAFRYLFYIVPRGKRPKQPFVFFKKLTEEQITRLCKSFISLNRVRTLSMFSALYWFAEFLHHYQAITAEECGDIQSWMRDWQAQMLPGFLKNSFSVRALQDFPL